jgi:hypothetical protein
MKKIIEITICDYCKKDMFSPNTITIKEKTYDFCLDCEMVLTAAMNGTTEGSAAVASPAAPETKDDEPKKRPVAVKAKKKEEPATEGSLLVTEGMIIAALGIDMRKPDEAHLCYKVFEALKEKDASDKAQIEGLINEEAAKHPIVFDPMMPHHRTIMQTAMEALSFDFKSEATLTMARKIKEKAVMEGVLLKNVFEFCKKECDVGF